MNGEDEEEELRDLQELLMNGFQSVDTLLKLNIVEWKFRLGVV